MRAVQRECAACQGEHGKLETKYAILCPHCRKARDAARRAQERRVHGKKANQTKLARAKREQEEEQQKREDARIMAMIREDRERLQRSGQLGDPGRSLSRAEIDRLLSEGKITDPATLPPTDIPSMYCYGVERDWM